MKEQLSNDEQLIALLNQLAQIQATLSNIVFARFQNSTIENANNQVQSKRKNIEAEAISYGQSPIAAEPAIQEYENGISGIQEQYSDEANLWLIKGAEDQQTEVEKVTEIQKKKNELKKMQRKGNSEQYVNQAEKYRREIESNRKAISHSRKSSNKARENIMEARDRCNSAIDEVAQDNDLVKAEKQNLFQKLFSKVINRIGGKEKFNKNVIQPLKLKAEHIKNDVIPATKENIEKTVIPKLKEMYSNGKEKIAEMNLSEKFNNLMSKAKEGAQSIIENSSGIKEKAVSAFSKVSEVVQSVASKIPDVVEKIGDAISESIDR